MKFFVDENIPLATVLTLRDMAHDVFDIRGTDQEGIADDQIWKQAQENKSILITTDKGFAKYRSQPHHGILIVRLKHPNSKKIHERIIKALQQFEPDDWQDLLVVMRDRAQSVWKKNTE